MDPAPGGYRDLPGTLPGQGIGDPITLDTPWTGQIVDRSFFTAPQYEAYRQPGRIKVPFWLQPERYYAGAAWYQADLVIPADWTGRRAVLTLERPHWQTLVARRRHVDRQQRQPVDAARVRPRRDSRRGRTR